MKLGRVQTGKTTNRAEEKVEKNGGTGVIEGVGGVDESRGGKLILKAGREKTGQ